MSALQRTRSTKPSLSVLGVMSGTSIDGLDLALCSIAGRSIRLEEHWHSDFSPQLARRLIRAAQGNASIHEAAQLHHDLGRFYADRAARSLGGRAIAIVGLHGQTVFHQPRKPAATFQLGEPAYLARRLAAPVVSNFRAADLAAGGEGAPLATLFHKIVFGRPGRFICINNLGGISNVTQIDWRQGEPRILAFDTGPGNVLIDLAVQRLTGGKQRFDRNGGWARRGHPAEELLSSWLRHPYFRRKPPKSTGRELFGESFFDAAWTQMRRARLSRFDMVATLTEFTARSIALNYRLHLAAAPEQVILCGGGGANEALVDRIRQSLSLNTDEMEVVKSDELSWPLQSIEPAAFALLAYYRWKKWPANIPSSTGARESVLLGQLSEP